MSQVPKDEKPKYNKDNKFAWVDSQWEKFMTEQKEHKALIKQLQKDLGTCTKNYQKMMGTYRGDEWRIDQFNRNRDIEDQVSTIEEMEKRVEEIRNV